MDPMMQRLEVRFVLMEPVAQLPTRGSEESAGWDLYSIDDLKLGYGRVAVVRTGIAMQMPPGFSAEIRGRSSLNAAGILCHIGTIDSDYRGELKVVLQNLAPQVRSSSTDYRAAYHIRPKQRIAQLVFSAQPSIEVVRAIALTKSKRDVGGFGSTGE